MLPMLKKINVIKLYLNIQINLKIQIKFGEHLGWGCPCEVLLIEKDSIIFLQSTFVTGGRAALVRPAVAGAARAHCCVGGVALNPRHTIA